MTAIYLNTYRTKTDPLKLQYPITIRITILFSIIPIIALMMLFPRVEVHSKTTTISATPFDPIDLPPVINNVPLPKPERPAIPVESENPDLAEDVTIRSTEIDDFGTWVEPPPPPEDGPNIIFVPYDEKPKPIGGRIALIRNVVYPPIAIAAGIEGVIRVRAFIDKNGKVTETQIVHGIPNTGLNEAAMNAIKKTRFKPAMQREIPVGVWFDIDINFVLSQ